ncbi:MAG: L,D-transpeptidase, partial [Actinomycetota bacterium]|nr:L,D-transpeptidase [Actinomycetota bacterium]
MALTALAALIPAIPIAIGIGIGIGAGGGGGAAARPLSLTALSAETRGASLRSTSSLSPLWPSSLPAGRGALVAVVLHGTTMRAAPRGRPIAPVWTRTGFGSSDVLWVVDRVPGWLGVIGTAAGNGRVGWIPASAASLDRVAWELKVSLSARRVTVIDAGKVLQRYTVAVGAPDSPTPTGRFEVTDRLATGDPTGSYGCCILALSAHSPHAIQDWSGGDRIAIHSTPESSSIGHPVSHGCMRLT